MKFLEKAVLYVNNNISKILGGSYVEAFNVTENLYINGVVLWVDLDYEWGVVVEVVERGSGCLHYVAVVHCHVHSESRWWKEIRWVKLDEDCGSFFDRNVEGKIVSVWGVHTIYEMIDNKISCHVLKL